MIEYIYQVRYLEEENGDISFLTDCSGNWEFNDLNDAIQVYTESCGKYYYLFLTQTPLINEEDFESLYPGEKYEVIVLKKSYS